MVILILSYKSWRPSLGYPKIFSVGMSLIYALIWGARRLWMTDKQLHWEPELWRVVYLHTSYALNIRLQTIPIQNKGSLVSGIQSSTVILTKEVLIPCNFTGKYNPQYKEFAYRFCPPTLHVLASTDNKMCLHTMKIGHSILTSFVLKNVMWQDLGVML